MEEKVPPAVYMERTQIWAMIPGRELGGNPPGRTVRGGTAEYLWGAREPVMGEHPVYFSGQNGRCGDLPRGLGVGNVPKDNLIVVPQQVDPQGTGGRIGKFKGGKSLGIDESDQGMLTVHKLPPGIIDHRNLGQGCGYGMCKFPIDPGRPCGIGAESLGFGNSRPLP